jgi:hypothetical protein
MKTEPLCQLCGVPESFHGLPPTEALQYPQHPFQPPANAMQAGKEVAVGSIPIEFPDFLRYAMEDHMTKTGAGNLERRGPEAAMRGAFASGSTAILSLVIHKDREGLEKVLAWWRAGLAAAGATKELERLDAFTGDAL